MGWTYMIHFLVIMSQSTKIWRVLHFEKLPFLIQTNWVKIRGSQLGLEFFLRGLSLGLTHHYKKN